MFVRWHQNANTGRLTANLAEGRRVEGKVKQQHVAALGSVPRDASAADRFAFWTTLHGKLALLDDRFDANEREAIYAAIHMRIPRPSRDELHADRARKAKEAADQWAAIADGQAETLEAKRQMLAALQRQIDDLTTVAADARAKATAASERAAVFARGDDPGGTDSPLTHEDIKRITGGRKPLKAAPLEPAPWISEVEYRSGVEWVQDLIARYLALTDTLINLPTAALDPNIKRFVALLSIVKLIKPSIPRASLALLFDLLSPAVVKLHTNAMRGAIAVGVDYLRSANMGNLQIEQWLDEEIRRRELDFTAHDAMRWFYRCNNREASLPSITLQIFDFYRPEPSLSPTETEAKKQMASCLDAAVTVNAGPLTQLRRQS